VKPRETTRARIARIHGEAARRIMLDALGLQEAAVALAFAAAVEKQVKSSLSFDRVLDLAPLADEEVVAAARREMEPEIRRRLGTASRLAS